MPNPHHESWQSASPYLDTALELAPAERAAWLASIHARSPELADQIARWLAECDAVEHDDFLAGAAAIEPTRSALTGLQLGAVSAGRADRPRRHGQRVAGRAHRRALRRPGRRQAAERRAGRPLRRGAVLARRAHPRPPDASADRPDRRCRRVADRPAVSRAGARRRRADRCALRPPAAACAPIACACSSTSWRRWRTPTPTWSCTATSSPPT